MGINTAGGHLWSKFLRIRTFWWAKTGIFNILNSCFRFKVSYWGTINEAVVVVVDSCSLSNITWSSLYQIYNNEWFMLTLCQLTIHIVSCEKVVSSHLVYSSQSLKRSKTFMWTSTAAYVTCYSHSTHNIYILQLFSGYHQWVHGWEPALNSEILITSRLH